MRVRRRRRGRLRRIACPGLALAVLGAAGTLGVAGPAPASPGTVMVSGTVFADEDGDGRRGPDEHGLRGVMVSDGAAVARSGLGGRYSLVVEAARRGTDLVFVSVPSGFAAPPGPGRIPRFFRAVTPDAGGRATADFGLRREADAAGGDLGFVALADVHVQAGSVNDRVHFTDEIRQVNAYAAGAGRIRPRFMVVTGDLTNNATPAEFADFRAATATSALPVWPAIGNHEYDLQAGGGYAQIVEGYRRAIGPEWYSFGAGGRHFVVLDDNQGFGQPDQLRWLERDLAMNARGREVVVILHQPLNVSLTPNPAVVPAYVKLLERYRTVLVLAGHTHANDVDDRVVAGAVHAVTTSSAYSTDSTPTGFRAVELSRGQVRLPYRQYGTGTGVTLVHPAPGARIPATATAVAVDADHPAGGVARATFRVDGGPPRGLRAAGDLTWVAPLDAARLRRGRHRIEVVVTANGGQRVSRSGTFEVADRRVPERPRSSVPWPMLHGGRSHLGTAVIGPRPPLGLAWHHQTGGRILTGSAVIAGGTVYAGVRDDSGTSANGVVAVDLATGRRRWRLRTDGMVDATPAVAGGTVYAASIRGTLYAVNAATGAVRWSRRMGGARRAWSYFAPTVAGRTLYQAYSLPDGAHVSALDAATGAERWRTRPIGDLWLSAGSPAVGDGKLFVATHGGLVTALDLATGAVRWSKSPRGGWTRSAPVIARNLVIMAHQSDVVIAMDAATGAERWRYRSPGRSMLPGASTTALPAVDGRAVYAGFTDGSVAALDLGTGLPLWRRTTGGAVLSSPVLAGGVLYAGSNDGQVRGFDAATGAQLWAHRIGPWVASSPAVSGNALVVGAWDGGLYAFTPTAGAPDGARPVGQEPDQRSQERADGRHASSRAPTRRPVAADRAAGRAGAARSAAVVPSRR